MVKATHRLYQTADKRQLVPEGDKKAAYLFCIPGQQVSDEDVEKYGLKAIKGSANKATPPDEDKSTKTAAAPAAAGGGKKKAGKKKGAKK